MSDDIIMMSNSSEIVTKWNVLKPREDFASGISCYWLDKGIKVSKIFDKNGNFLYYYCDIIETAETPDGIIFYDLLIDVVINADGFVKVLDIGEFSDALDKGVIDTGIAKKALWTLDYLLNEIYTGRFSILSAPTDNI